MEWMLMPLRRYADFSGRSRRKEYWMFALGILLAYAVLGALFLMGANLSAMGTGAEPEISSIGWIAISLFGILALGIFIPSLAVIVRRLHDQDKSGWFIRSSSFPISVGSSC